MNEVKNNFIRQINKSRRKTISVMNKINNNSEIGPVIYKDYLFKFQQLENTILILNEQLKDLDTIYNFEKNKTVIENKILDNNKFQSLKKSDIDILFPLFYCYYNKLYQKMKMTNICHNHNLIVRLMNSIIKTLLILI